MDDLAAVVIDNGSGKCRIGFAGDDSPRSCFAPVVGGTLQGEFTSLDIRKAQSFVGEEAQKKRDTLALKYPVERGYIEDWDSMEKVWEFALHDQLHASPEQQPLLITEPPLNPRASREKAAQIVFEAFGAPAFYPALQPALCLYDCALYTSIVLDSGHGVTHATAFYEFSSLTHSTIRLDFAGHDLTESFRKAMHNRGHTTVGYKEAELMKERYCYSALDPLQEHDRHPPTSKNHYELPDGQKIPCGDERFLVPEALFQSGLAGIDSKSIPQMIRECILKCDADLHHLLYRKIVVAGGTTMVPGFSERLRKELVASAPDTKISVVSPAKGRPDTVWIGGSILASLSTFQSMWCTRHEYDEIGPDIIQYKCMM